MSTTTIAVNVQTTITSVIDTTQTAIVQGVKRLELKVINKIPSSASSQNEFTQYGSGTAGITLINKNNSPSTISTFTTVVTSSSTLSNNRVLGSELTYTSFNSPTLSSHTAIPSSVNSTASTGSTNAGSNNNQVIPGNSLFGETSTAKSETNIGLVIGIPIAVIGTSLIVFGIWFYLRQKQQKSLKADENLKNYYDEKYNYKISPLNDSQSPYLRHSYHFETTSDSKTGSDTNTAPSINVLNNHSQYSLKEPHTGPALSNWNLNTPLSKWFAKHSQGSGENSSTASLSTGPHSPMITLKEFKLNKLRGKNGHSGFVDVNEKSPMLPKFPENAYHPNGYQHKFDVTGENGTFDDSISQQVIKNDLSKTQQSVPKIKPIPENKIKNKPLPEQPVIQTTASTATLEGLEQRVYERMFPSTPQVSKNFFDDTIYIVILNYSKNLADELNIDKGEYVKILARHTDGWCLAEKCDKKGNMLAEGERYINDGRGVIPEMCLKRMRRQ